MGDKAKVKRKPIPHIGVGSPGILRLQQFGEVLNDAFGETAYLVGSAARGKEWRDVDVRVILDDTAFYRLLGHSPHESPRWKAMAMAFSTLGTDMTGLPIDFQLQGMTHANGLYGGEVRVPLFTRYDTPEHDAWSCPDCLNPPGMGE